MLDAILEAKVTAVLLGVAAVWVAVILAVLGMEVVAVS